MIGKTISHYRILEKLGEGGMGVVYKAQDTKLDRVVALKFLPKHLLCDEEAKTRFAHEAKAASALNHTNITTIHEIDEVEGECFICMEYVEGKSIKELIKEKTLSIEEVLKSAIQIAEGLNAAHKKDIVHRDIKSDNIMLTHEGLVKIMDFGLAKLKGVSKLTKTGTTVGTMQYMSPEQAQGIDVDQRSDIFSFGVVLYEIITGQLPFKGEHEAAIIYSILNDTPEPLARYKTGVPDELQRIVGKMLDKDRSARYQHSDDLLADLRAYSKQGLSSIVEKPHRDLWNRYVVTSAVAILVIIAGYWIVTTYVLHGTKNPESGRKMLAVLPFQNFSPDPDQDYFSDGLTEELITNLSTVKSLCVISRSSAMTFKGSNKKVPEIAKELKVQYIVEGSVRKAGKELRITAQLIDAANDAHLWANTYTGTLDDVFAMQDSVTRAIVEAIRVQLTPDETQQLEKRSFNNTAAFEYYLRGKDEIRIGTEDAINRGLQYLKHGIDVVGDNALIYGGMAWGYWSMVNNGFAQEEGVSRAQEYAQMALNLNPDLPQAHAMLGWINMAFMGNQRKAVEHFKRALAIDPNNENALNGLAIAYFEYVGKVSAAVPLIDRYLVVSPVDSVLRFTRQGDLHFFTGAYYQALEPYRRVHRVNSGNPVEGFFYAMTLAYCDSINEAFSVIDECVKANPTSSVVNLLLLMRLALQKDKAGTLRELTPELQRTCRRDAAWSYHVGALLALAAAKEEALGWLENAVNKGFINYPFLEKDPFLDSIRGEEQFKNLMERVKYEWEHFEV
ncbi:MAG: protein kinase [Chloroflexota bacterium]